MRVRSVLFGALLIGAFSGCHRQASPAPTATLVLSVSPQVASVLLDDQPLLVQSTSGGPVRLRIPVGQHRIEVRALRHLAAYRDVIATQGQEAKVSITLRRDPEAESDAGSDSSVGQPFAPTPRPLALPARL